MELKPRSLDKIQQLISHGVDIPNPLTLDIGEEVRVEQISPHGVKIYPGCRIYGEKTVIAAGAKLGYEAPVTVDDCQIGPGVELKGGFFKESVFLERACMGLGARLGGEESGHIIFLDHHTTGDGLLAAIQLIAAMLRQGKPLSELAAGMEIYPQKLRNVAVRSKPEISSIPDVQEVIREVEKDLGGHGRVLVRYSGSQDLCRVMVEGPSRELTENYCNRIAEAVDKALGRQAQERPK